MEKPAPRKYTLTSPTVYFLDYIMAHQGKGAKEQTEVVCYCISKFFQLFAEVKQGTSPQVDDSENPALLRAGMNLMYRGSGVDTIWCRMPSDVLKKLDIMVEQVHVAYGFKSSSSIVNHAIAHVFEGMEGAMAQYFKDEVTGKS